ncbi:hypothetical protein MLD38_024047 [Melastoma candidum]|uniref:Uncharacterized protein n=1 Tax=Melastoma candidum TaxID=119954 RepID=A0ACB9NXU1_9MYRT|nr:hypothetical protein MLD38_024047 [Melastoma candidum]
MATVVEEPILSRIDRLDLMLKQLEEIRGVSRSTTKSSSGASSPSSGTLTSGDVPTSSSLDASPRSIEKHCRPIDRVVMETEVKGTLVDRLDLVESRIMKLCLRMEEELEEEKRRKGRIDSDNKAAGKKGGGLKHMFRKLLKGGGDKHRHHPSSV